MTPDADRGLQPDPRLVRLAETWDGLDEDTGQLNVLAMTVLVSGTIYSGLLVPGRVWARAMADLLRGAPPGPQIDALSGLFHGMESDFESVEATSEAGRYLHLVNLANGLPNPTTQTSLLMRIRVADVSGWALGSAGELPPPGFAAVPGAAQGTQGAPPAGGPPGAPGAV